MRSEVEALCADECEGRAPGTRGGVAARQIVIDGLRRRGLDPSVQVVPGCGGANVLAVIPGDIDRYVLVGAHYDHLGRQGKKIFRGADDNAAAVAILMTVAGALRLKRPAGRGVIVAAFDAEEPPHFLEETMGSQHYCRHPLSPLDRLDMMVCMDLVGHSFGDGAQLPGEVRQSLFALGSERSSGTAGHVDALAAAVPGVRVRRVDAEAIPPLSDYEPFWRRQVPFLFLSSGRSRHYHTPEDTPERLDYEKMAATARWLERFVRETCQREGPIAFLPGARDDAATLRSLRDIVAPLRDLSDEAQLAHDAVDQLLDQCAASGKLPGALRPAMQALLQGVETRLG